jgi:hypothetical protein
MQVKAAMNKSVVTAVAFAGFVIAGPALAADLSYTPPVPTFSWTGVYVGVHAGAGWSLNEQSFSGSGSLLSENNYTGSGFLGGLQGGFNYQTGPWVLGAEAQFSWADLDGKDHCIAASPVALLNCHAKADWLGTAAAHRQCRPDQGGMDVRDWLRICRLRQLVGQGRIRLPRLRHEERGVSRIAGLRPAVYRQRGGCPPARPARKVRRQLPFRWRCHRRELLIIAFAFMAAVVVVAFLMSLWGRL